MSEEPFDWEGYKSDRWTPEKKGDKIAGRVSSIRVEKGTKDENVPVVTLWTQGRHIDVYCSAILLRTAVADLEPQKGDGLAIELTELRHTGQKSPLKVFEVKYKTAAQIDAERAKNAPTPPPAAESTPDAGTDRPTGPAEGPRAIPETDTWDDLADRVNQLPKPRQAAIDQWLVAHECAWGAEDVPADLLELIERHESQAA